VIFNYLINEGIIGAP